MAEGDDAVAESAHVHNAIERLKRRPVLALVLFLSLVTAAVATLWNALASGGDFVSRLVEPHSDEYAALADLDLDVRLEYFEANFGTVKSVVDACRPDSCPNAGGPPLQLYIHETEQATVRALFEGNSLRAYLVTTTADGFLNRPGFGGDS